MSSSISVYRDMFVSCDSAILLSTVLLLTPNMRAISSWVKLFSVKEMTAAFNYQLLYYQSFHVDGAAFLSILASKSKALWLNTNVYSYIFFFQ